MTQNLQTLIMTQTYHLQRNRKKRTKLNVEEKKTVITQTH